MPQFKHLSGHGQGRGSPPSRRPSPFLLGHKVTLQMRPAKLTVKRRMLLISPVAIGAQNSPDLLSQQRRQGPAMSAPGQVEPRRPRCARPPDDPRAPFPPRPTHMLDRPPPHLLFKLLVIARQGPAH